MKKWITPTWKINSIYSIKPEALKAKELQGIIVDLDNTLIPWNQLDHSNEVLDWINNLRTHGIGIYILSNNSYRRVERVATPLEVTFTASALKPRRKHFTFAMDQLMVPKENIVVIGDQIITDIVGANRNGLKSILVKPLVAHDNIFTLLNRTLEKGALKLLGIDRHADWGDTID